jgi:hypothetical protein
MVNKLKELSGEKRLISDYKLIDCDIFNLTKILSVF